MSRSLLAQACSDLLLLAVEVQKPGATLPEAPVFRERVKERLRTFETEAERLGFGKPDVEDAKYAMVAAIDEALHFSSWQDKLAWEIDPLQAEIFGERNAGVGFFERLERVRERSRDVLEVYYLCLSAGFQGRYRLTTASELAKLLEHLALDIGYERKLLSPHGVHPGPLPEPSRSFPWLGAAAGLLAVAVSVATLLFFLLSGARDEAVAAIGVFGR